MKKLYNKIILKRKELKINKEKMISILSIKVWIMHRYQHINRQLNLKLYRKFKWGNIFQKPGIIHPIPFIIIMESVFTYASFVQPSLIYQNNLKNIPKSVLCIIHLEIKFTETNNKKQQYFKLMDLKIQSIVKTQVYSVNCSQIIKICNGI